MITISHNGGFLDFRVSDYDFLGFIREPWIDPAITGEMANPWTERDYKNIKILPYRWQDELYGDILVFVHEKYCSLKGISPILEKAAVGHLLKWEIDLYDIYPRISLPDFSPRNHQSLKPWRPGKCFEMMGFYVPLPSVKRRKERSFL